MMDSDSRIHHARIQPLNSKPFQQRAYALYWMQASQRTEYNHALEYAIDAADRISRPLLVYFGLTGSYPEANERHYRFMVDGLREVEAGLADRGVRMLVARESPETGAVALARNACLVVTDRGYTRIQRRWREHVAREADVYVVQVESDVVVPVEIASAKEEYSAATFRPKASRQLAHFVRPMESAAPRLSAVEVDHPSLNLADITDSLESLGIDASVQTVSGFRGGATQADRRLREFIDTRLDRYGDLRNDPGLDLQSNLSPYLHFGQISPLQVYLAVMESGSPGAEAYVEELVIRRELAVNFVNYNPRYDSFDCLPAWVRNSLQEHSEDGREYDYALDDLEHARTHDEYWNAAQLEMVRNGKMHGYMRMYWGKKMLEWTADPSEAFRLALHLNNKYELDGRDPNGFAGVAWCFGKHDRPWAERPVFGKVRYMSAGGLARKFDMKQYVRRVSALDDAAGKDNM